MTTQLEWKSNQDEYMIPLKEWSAVLERTELTVAYYDMVDLTQETSGISALYRCFGRGLPEIRTRHE